MRGTIWEIKLRHFCAILVLISLMVYLIYLALQPEDLSSISKRDFLKLRKSHRSRTLENDVIEHIIETDRNYFKNTLLQPMLKERVPDTQGNREVQQHIKDHMSSLGWAIKEDPFEDNTPHGQKHFNNIIAIQDQNAPRKLTLACHFDSKFFADFVFIGATDSAVPCAMIMDLATALNRTLWGPNKNPQITLQLIFFDGEEAFERWTATDSIYGARHLAAKMGNTKREVLREVIVSELEDMDLFCLLDLIGTPNPRFSNWFPATSKQFEALQEIERRLSRLGALSYGVESRNVYFSGRAHSGSGIEDDHVPFLRRNVPILHLIAYPFPSVWHKERDNESALDYDTIDDLNKIMRVFVAEYLQLQPQIQ